MEQRATINGVRFNLPEVLLLGNKETWVEWASPRFYEGYNDLQKRRLLTEVWEKAEEHARSLEAPVEEAAPPTEEQPKKERQIPFANKVK